jgi:four helix bundle protein
MKSYKELEVWQKAIGFALNVYKITENFPHGEKFGLTIQIHRAAVSIAANIAEGWGRGTTKEYIQFLIIARGSLMELETHLIIAEKLKYLNVVQLQEAQKVIEEIGKMLNRLITVLRSR